MVYIPKEFNEPQVPELDDAERELDAAVISDMAADCPPPSSSRWMQNQLNHCTWRKPLGIEPQDRHNPVGWH
ncbi:hypothetical protein ACMFMG_006585 [Clarireedia jacksonii]